MIKLYAIAASVIAATAAIQKADSRAAVTLPVQQCSEVMFSGKITKKLFADGTQEVVGLMVKLDDGNTVEVEVPKYNQFETFAGAEAKLKYLVTHGPKVQFKATQCEGTLTQPTQFLGLLP